LFRSILILTRFSGATLSVFLKASSLLAVNFADVGLRLDFQKLLFNQEPDRHHRYGTHYAQINEIT
jgi:hypothetical protein